MIQLEIVTPEKKVFSDQVDNVYLPTSTGEIGVLSMHTTMVTELNAGQLRYLKDGVEVFLAVGPGFAELGATVVKVLVDSAFGEDQIDEVKVQEAMERAEKQIATMDHSQDAEEIAYLQSVIAKSMAQLHLKRRH